MNFLRKLKALIKLSSTRGLYLPIAYDGPRKPPSARLFFTHVSFYIAALSVILLHAKIELLTASITAICFFALCTVLYMLRDLRKAKLDLDDKEIELESSDEGSKNE